MEIKINNLVVCSLNCVGVRRSKDDIQNFLDSTSCDVLCLQETWIIDSNISMFSSINNNYLCTCISGIDHTTYIIIGCPHGGVAILYKKSLIILQSLTAACLVLILLLTIFHLLFYQFICLVILIQELLLIRNFPNVFMILNVFLMIYNVRHLLVLEILTRVSIDCMHKPRASQILLEEII